MGKIANAQAIVKARFLNLRGVNRSPHEIALGAAIGVFIGITPFYGFHILMAFIAALAFKGLNRTAIFLGINISLPPTIPFITWAGYSLGRKLLGSSYPPLGWDAFKDFLSIENFFHFFYVLSVGSIVLGIVLGIFFYFLIVLILKRRKTIILVNWQRGF